MGQFYRWMEGFPNVLRRDTIFDDLADRQVHGRSISPAHQKTNVLATDVGVALSRWDLEDRIYRLRDLIVAYRTLATEDANGLTRYRRLTGWTTSCKSDLHVDFDSS